MTTTMVLTVPSVHRFKHQMLHWHRPSLLFAVPWTATLLPSKTHDWWPFDSRWHQPEGSEGFVGLKVLDNVNKCMFKFMTMAASELFHPACLRVREVLVEHGI